MGDSTDRVIFFVNKWHISSLCLLLSVFATADINQPISHSVCSNQSHTSVCTCLNFGTSILSVCMIFLPDKCRQTQIFYFLYECIMQSNTSIHCHVCQQWTYIQQSLCQSMILTHINYTHGMSDCIHPQIYISTKYSLLNTKHKNTQT